MRQIVRGFLLIGLLLMSISVFAQDETLLPITEDVTYTVRPSDGLETIGALFDVSPVCIAETNDLPIRSRLEIDQELLISVSCPVYGWDPRDYGTMTVEIPREVVTFVDEECLDGYRVHKDDSVDLIAFNYGVSTQSVILLNNLEEPYLLQVNDCVLIPDPDEVPPYGEFPAMGFANPDLEAGGGVSIGEPYVVQQFDTLDVIAQAFDKSVQAIMTLNALERGTDLRAGMVIIIPEDAPPYGQVPATGFANASFEGGGGSIVAGETHVLQPFEALDVIAQAYDKSLACILEQNAIEDTRSLTAGTIILIPDSCPSYAGSSLGDSIAPAGGE